MTANKLDDAAPEDISHRLFAPATRQSGDFGRRKESRVVLPALPSWSESMGLTAFFAARTQAQEIFASGGTKPKLFPRGNFLASCQDLAYAVRLMSKEKEILLFAALQWLVIALACVLWVQVIDWIPASAWANAEHAVGDNREAASGLASLILWGWSALVIATAAYPIALFNASIAAAHYLRTSNQPSTIPACLKLASKHLVRLWLFVATDAFVTVSAIFDRLPKKRGRRTALEEAAYYAWKIATAGVLPSLVAGKDFVAAAKDSISLLQNQPARVIGIRMAYSLVCWVVGILAYAGAIVFFMVFGAPLGTENWLYHLYILVGAPIVLAAGLASLVRPLFVIAMSKVYTDVVPVKVESDGMVVVEPANEIEWPTLAFAVLLGIVLALYFAS